LGVAEFKALAGAVPTLRSLSLRYGRSLALQVSFTALANAKFEIRQRLARWLLMIQDRTDMNPFNLTHEYISIMLGVRRPSVTEAMHVLEGERLIRSTRNEIEIVDRRGLVSLAGEIYGSSERDYERLMRLGMPERETNRAQVTVRRDFISKVAMNGEA